MCFIVPLHVLAMTHADKPYLEAKRLCALFFAVVCQKNYLNSPIDRMKAIVSTCVGGFVFSLCAMKFVMRQ